MLQIDLQSEIKRLDELIEKNEVLNLKMDYDKQHKVISHIQNAMHEYFNAIVLLNSENEVGVSDASKEHGGLPPVREWNAHGPVADSQIASEHGAFRNRISDEKKCPSCGKNLLEHNVPHYIKKYCTCGFKAF